MRARGRARGLVLGLAMLLAAATARAQAPEVHGQTATFAGHGITVVWGVLQRPVEAETEVVMRLVPAPGAWAHVSVDAIDPFAGTRRAVVTGCPLGTAVDVRSPRSTFADWPRREIRLFRTQEALAAGQPALTIFYLGVPDTTPEFRSEPALLTYLGGQTLQICQFGAKGTEGRK